jgi:hypothetical protein
MWGFFVGGYNAINRHVSKENKMRGRPPKPKVEYPMGESKHIESRKVAELSATISNLYDVARLNETQITKLLGELVYAMGSYQAAKDLRINIPAKSRGNKNKTHVQVLLQDCARAWSAVSGQNSTRITALIWSILNARQQTGVRLSKC